MSTENPPPTPPDQNAVAESGSQHGRRDSQHSDDSRTAAEYLREQLQMEADAREAMPYSISSCTSILGPLRQNVYACLTCNPPSAPDFSPAGMCYACSVQCHGEHTLVEIFQKRSFTCDCGTTRFPATSPCALRIHPDTNTKGGVHTQLPDANNRYGKNFANVFCGCDCDYDPFKQRGTMFQCLGLGTSHDGGCGEDWYHPGCLVGRGPNWFEETEGQGPRPKKVRNGNEEEAREPSGGNALPAISEEAEGGREMVMDEEDDHEEDEDDELPMPPGFPEEEEFEGFICHKCVDANPWIKQYAGAPCFLPPVFLGQANNPAPPEPEAEANEGRASGTSGSRKRKAEEDEDETTEMEPKRHRSEAPSEDVVMQTQTAGPVPVQSDDGSLTKSAVEKKLGDDDDDDARPPTCKLSALPPAPAGSFSLFFTKGFRDKLCHCPPCYRLLLSRHPQLLEEEEAYEPPLSIDGGDGQDDRIGDGSTRGSGSLLERGESALLNVDRVRAIEGVMAYNHLREQLKPFFAQFAGTGRAISAEDIKEYFARLRGDEGAIKEAREAAGGGGGAGGAGTGGDGRHEQSGY